MDRVRIMTKEKRPVQVEHLRLLLRQLLLMME